MSNRPKRVAHHPPTPLPLDATPVPVPPLKGGSWGTFTFRTFLVVVLCLAVRMAYHHWLDTKTCPEDPARAEWVRQLTTTWEKRDLSSSMVSVPISDPDENIVWAKISVAEARGWKLSTVPFQTKDTGPWTAMIVRATGTTADNIDNPYHESGQ
jgi:hypothetical protein